VDRGANDFRSCWPRNGGLPDRSEYEDFEERSRKAPLLGRSRDEDRGRNSLPYDLGGLSVPYGRVAISRVQAFVAGERLDRS
jgi:hypothetical protein